MVTLPKPFLCQFVNEVKEPLKNADLKDVRDLFIKRLKSTKYKLSKNKVLILTRKYDPETDLVCLRLLNRRIDYVRLNVEDIPERVLITHANRRCTLTVGAQTVDASRIRMVLLRSFDVDEVDFGGDDFVRKFSFQQWQDAFQILQNHLKCEWVNSYGATVQANDRAQQLSIARKLGFRTPDTTITNDPKKARDFYRSRDGNVVIKTLHHHGVELKDKVYSMYTRSLTGENLDRLDDLVYAPCILQEKIYKKAELRVTVIGNKVFAARLDIKEQQDIHCCRADDISITPFDLKKSENRRCIKLMKMLGLDYGAIDFIVDKKDRLVFLEVNAAGDWYWIENKTEQLITKAVTDLLENRYYKRKR
jgi:glutathione synthase/RimK-type ligase-like ATP-grasp enzyme